MVGFMAFGKNGIYFRRIDRMASAYYAYFCRRSQHKHNFINPFET